MSDKDLKQKNKRTKKKEGATEARKRKQQMKRKHLVSIIELSLFSYVGS